MKEVEQELEKIANERKAATEKVILTDAFDTRNDFEPIVETFSEDDAIVIKPKQTIDEHPAEAQETDYIIEDNTVKNGKLATVDIDNERQRAAFTVANKPNEPNFTAMEFDDSKINNKGFDDVTIGLETAKVRSCISIQSTHFFSVIAKFRLFSFVSFLLYFSSLLWFGQYRTRNFSHFFFRHPNLLRLFFIEGSNISAHTQSKSFFSIAFACF